MQACIYERYGSPDVVRLGEVTSPPVVDHVYPMEQIVDAHRRVDGRHKRGSVVVTVPSSPLASLTSAA